MRKQETAMISDVIESTTPESSPLVDTMLEEYTRQQRLQTAFRATESEGTPLRRGDRLLAEALSCEESLTARRREAYARDQKLPAELLRTMLIELDRAGNGRVWFDREDGLTRAAGSPRATLAHLRDVATRLGFILVPFGFLSDDYLKLDGAEEAVQFNDTMSEECAVYVLAPVSAYDVGKRVRAQADQSVFFDENDPVMLSLEMTVPTLRALWGGQQALTDRVGAVETAVTSLASRLDAAEKRAAAERASRLELEARSLRRQDPLVFAVPRNTDVRTDEANAVLGPCWGERVELAVFEALGLRRKR